MARLPTLVAALGIVALLALAPAIGAVHLYRGPGGGCTPAVGNLGDPLPSGGATKTVLVLHNTYLDTSTGLPLTVINVGDTVTWTWNSEHCHSVQDGASIDSGFHYPEPTPTTPLLLPGLVEYPVPTLEPKLSYTLTFPAPGVYNYICIHHNLIGMHGTVIVQ
ncbi:MAG TPA: plastocyanin/azurin family copper-binding protein [Candidatus Thermoplasmatota archaeon]|jgi:plastocyanin|nr:plastocyanin/azurin family copper-binding protein [Candidatus Thermoplasmatota archaeon]